MPMQAARAHKARIFAGEEGRRKVRYPRPSALSPLQTRIERGLVSLACSCGEPAPAEGTDGLTAPPFASSPKLNVRYGWVPARFSKDMQREVGQFRTNPDQGRARRHGATSQIDGRGISAPQARVRTPAPDMRSQPSPNTQTSAPQRQGMCAPLHFHRPRQACALGRADARSCHARRLSRSSGIGTPTNAAKSIVVSSTMSAIV